MMLDAEDRAVVLAEGQLERRAYMVPDPDESDEPGTCEVCFVALVPRQVRWVDGRLTWRNPTKGTRLCVDCIRIGWRNASCVVCGSVTRSWNWTAKARGNKHRGWCQTCRDRDNLTLELR